MDKRKNIDLFNIDPELKKAFDVYIEHFMSGQTQVESALRAGIPYENVVQWIRIAETDEYVKYRKAEIESQFKMDKLWSPAIAVLNLLRMVNDLGERGANRLAAMKELNVLAGITIIDDQGRTRIPTLGDMYDTIAGGAAGAGENPDYPERPSLN